MQALSVLRRNVALNGFSDRGCVEALDWKSWRGSQPTLGSFGTILGADLLYLTTITQVLLNCVKAACTSFASGTSEMPMAEHLVAVSRTVWRSSNCSLHQTGSSSMHTSCANRWDAAQTSRCYRALTRALSVAKGLQCKQ